MPCACSICICEGPHCADIVTEIVVVICIINQIDIAFININLYVLSLVNGLGSVYKLVSHLIYAGSPDSR